MLKRAILLLAVLLQIGLFSVAPVSGDDLPAPDCWPCAR